MDYFIKLPKVGSSGGSAAWGSITGTLSNQTDLQSALNTKANLTGATFTGNISVTKATGNSDITIESGAATDNKDLSFKTNGLHRFVLRVDQSTDDFTIRRHDDLGVFIDSPITIVRSTGYSSALSRFGIGTTSPTHSLTLASTGTGAIFYNTTDQTTNFERARSFWNSNTFELSVTSNGTGTQRSLQLGVAGSVGATANRLFKINPTAVVGAGNFDFNNGGSSAAGAIATINGTINGSANIQAAFQITPTSAQSGTASFKAIYVSPFLQSSGSGGNLLLDIGTNSAASNSGTHTQVFTIDNNGNMQISGSIVPIASNVALNLRARAAYSVAGTGVLLANSTYNSSSGSSIPVNINPIYNQTGTASSIDLFISRTDTSLGSGSHRFIECRVGATTLFAVSNQGRIGINVAPPSASMVNLLPFSSTDNGIVMTGTVAYSGNFLRVQDSSAAQLLLITSSGRFDFASSNTASTVGATGAASALPAQPLGYIIALVAGSPVKIPYYNN